MANQYTGNFEQIVASKFNCTAREMLLKCQKEGFSYQDAEKLLGFKHVTIRKWSKRYNIKLVTKFQATEDRTDVNRGEVYINECRSDKINQVNILSRCWINMSLYSAIKARH